MTNGDEFRRRISNGRSNGLAGVEICPSEPAGLMESHLDLEVQKSNTQCIANLERRVGVVA